MFNVEEGYTSHMVNSLSNIKDIQEVKTVVKTENKKN